MISNVPLSIQISSYVRGKFGRQLKECTEQVEAKKEEIQSLESNIEAIRASVAELDREIHEAGATILHLRENVRFRKLKREYVAIQDELSSIDIEEAAKAHRQFDKKYASEKSRETELQGNVS